MKEISIEIETLDKEPKEIKLPAISGSFLKSFVADTLIANTAFSAIWGFGTPISSMKKLNQPLQGLLLASPLITNMMTQIPMTWSTNKNGGKKSGLVLLGATIVGMGALTTLYACVDISSIETFDWRYLVMLSSGSLIGYGAGTNLMIMDALKWAPKKTHIPYYQMLNSFCVNLSGVTTPILMYYLGTWGYFIPTSIYTGSVLASGLMGLLLVQPSPYNQLIAKFPKEKAKDLAKELGQLPDYIADYEDVSVFDVLKENCSVFIDRRSLLLGSALFIQLGNSYMLRTILPSVLTKGFNLGLGESVVASSLLTLLNIMSRPVATELINRLDKSSGGIAVHLLGTASTVLGTLCLGSFNLPRWGLYPCLGMASIGSGINSVTPLSIANVWAKPSKKSTLNPVNAASVFSIFGTLGILGGIILPLFLGLLLNQGGDKTYQIYFFAITALMMLSAFCIPIVDYQVRKKSIFESATSFFGKLCNIKGNAQQMVIPVQELVSSEAVVNDPEREEDIYVEQMI